MWKNPATYGLTLVVLVIGGWFLWALTKEQTPRYLTEESVRKVKVGMTEEEVEALLGAADHHDYTSSSSGSSLYDAIEIATGEGEPSWDQVVCSWKGLMRDEKGCTSDASVVVTLKAGQGEYPPRVSKIEFQGIDISLPK